MFTASDSEDRASKSVIGHGRRRRCSATGKVAFRDHREAVKAVRASTTSRQRALEAGATLDAIHRRERRVYACPDCGMSHLTSRPRLQVQGRQR